MHALSLSSKALLSRLFETCKSSGDAVNARRFAVRKADTANGGNWPERRHVFEAGCRLLRACERRTNDSIFCRTLSVTAVDLRSGGQRITPLLTAD